MRLKGEADFVILRFIFGQSASMSRPIAGPFHTGGEIGLDIETEGEANTAKCRKRCHIFQNRDPILHTGLYVQGEGS